MNYTCMRIFAFDFSKSNCTGITMPSETGCKSGRTTKQLKDGHGFFSCRTTTNALTFCVVRSQTSSSAPRIWFRVTCCQLGQKSDASLGLLHYVPAQ